MKAEKFLIRYETILEMVETEKMSVNDIVLDLQEEYPQKQIFETLSRMQDKKYIEVRQDGKVVKLKDLSTFSD